MCLYNVLLAHIVVQILDNFFELWWLADADLLAAAQRYTLADTGQGLQRKQAAPGVERRMRHILAVCALVWLVAEAACRV